jgi:dephospho-CoA kinase
VTEADLKELKALKEKANLLLLGVTGGIASGKTTVANMFKELGAPTIDFDVLAREVVQPGRAAWKEIVDSFGQEVVQADGHLDRKRLAEIVFQDQEKRRMLEAIIHPCTFEEYARQVPEIVNKDPNAIIQVVIPLVIELKLQDLFHKILLVYIPREKQIERLIRRDGISSEGAARMLRAQLPIDEKLPYADFVIHNEHSLEDTKRQVEELWERLKEIQRGRAKR